MKNWWREWDILALLALMGVALLSLRTFFEAGFFYTHDSEWHLVRLYHFWLEINQGQFPVRVATGLAEGYGYPVFQFFYPLPYMVSMLLRWWGLSLGDSIKGTYIISSLLSIWVGYGWLRSHFGKWPAFLGALLFWFVPYRFLTLYVTGQVGTAWSFVWAPACFWSFHLWLKNQNQFALKMLSFSIAAWLLSHLISVMAFLPFSVMYGLLLWRKYGLSYQKSLGLVISVILGLGISAFYWVPAYLEASVVKLGHQVLVNYQDHWPTFRQVAYSKWGYGFSGSGLSDDLSFQLGLAQWLILLSALGLCLLCLVPWVKKNLIKSSNLTLAFGFTVMSLVTILLMLSLSNFWWQFFSPFQYLQYPWRLLLVTMTVIPWLAAWIATQYNWGRALVILAILVGFWGNRHHLKPWQPERWQDSHYLENYSLMAGSTDISWEALPVAAKPPQKPAESLVLTPDNLSVSAKPSANHTFTTNFSESTIVTLNLLYFPSWQVAVNGKHLTTSPDSNGLLSFQAPAEAAEVEVKLGSSALQSFSNMTSFGAFLLWLWLVCWGVNFKTKAVTD